MMCSHDDRYNYNNYKGDEEVEEEEDTHMDRYDDGVDADDTKMSSDADVTSRSTSPDDCQSRPTYYYSDQIMATTPTITTTTTTLIRNNEVLEHHQDHEIDAMHNDEEERTATSHSAVSERDEAVLLLSSKNQQVPQPQPIAATKELFKKAPNAPKQSNSAYIHFAGAMQKKIRALMRTKSLKERTANICKVVADAWKKLSPEEREPWEAIAREDRARYELEKSLYKGPWRVPKTRRAVATSNAPKSPNPPSKPKSAFSAFAKKRRAQVKRQMPDASNGEIFKVLSTMWKEAPASVRQDYVSEVSEKQNIYQATMEETEKAEGSTERPQPVARVTPKRGSTKNVNIQGKNTERRTERLQREPVTRSVPERENANYKSNPDGSKIQISRQGESQQGYQMPPQQQQQHVVYHHQTQTHDHSAYHPLNGSKALVTLMVVADYSPPPLLGNNHRPYPPPEPTHLKYVAYDNRAREDQQDLLENFFYPDYLREAIQRASKEYEKSVQTRKAKHDAFAT